MKVIHVIVGFASHQGQNQKFVLFIGRIELLVEITQKIRQAVNQLIAAGKKEMTHLELQTVSIQRNHLINWYLFILFNKKYESDWVYQKHMAIQKQQSEHAKKAQSELLAGSKTSRKRIMSVQ